MYAKRLKEYIRYNCKGKKRFAQAAIIISNTNGDYIIDSAYKPSNKVGRPEIVKHICSFGCRNKELNTDCHLHLLLVSYPSCIMQTDIKRYIEKNWQEIPSLYKVEEFDWKYVGVKVYKKQCNIEVSSYMFKQAEEILFCNYNYLDREIVPKGYSLKALYYEYLKVNSAKWYSNEYLTRKGKAKVVKRYNELMAFYTSIMKEYDDKAELKFKKALEERLNKVQNANHKRFFYDPMFSGEI